MRKTIIAMTVAVVLLVGLWFASLSSASVKQLQGAPVHGTAAYVTSSGAASVASELESVSESGAQSESESASGPESESEQGATAETGGHEDPNGQDVNHECPPNCDTASGEQP